MRRMKARLWDVSRKLISLALCATIVVQLVSCGTLLYPERRGQTSGRVDPAVVLLDAIGLFFFIIPGVIAFAVDFYTGCIYLPGNYPDRPLKDRLKEIFDGKKKATIGGLLVVQMDPEELTPDTIATIITEETGYPLRLDDSRLIVRRADEGMDIVRELKRLAEIPKDAERVVMQTSR